MKFLRSLFYSFSGLISKLPGFSKQKNSLAFLNGAQFLGVLNDNIFKLVLVFLMIETLGKNSASSILSAAGAIYVIPFLLFSSAAGILADKFSKQRLLVAMKAAEIIIMVLALFAFGMRSQWGSFTLLFLLSTHSAMFGPSKYGIIPELVPKEGVSRANGLVTSFTYLAMIVGTFLASFLTDITNHNFMFVVSFCLLVAMSGFICAFGIKKTPSQGSKKKLNPFFISEIYQTLRFCNEKKHMLPAIYGAAYFLFLGAFTQLNIIPYGMQSLGLSDVAGGYLFLSTALGIALGSYLAGKASRKRVELGLSCFACFAMSLLFILLSIFSHHLFFVIICLVLVGICGGAFIVPCETFMQVNSPDEKRGQVIAAANFLSFSGVLLASFTLFFFSQVLGLSSAQGFFAVALLSLVVAILLIMRIADLSLSYFSRKILHLFFKVKAEHFELLGKNPKAILILKNATKLDAWLLLGILPETRFMVREIKPSLWSRFFYNVTSVPPEEKLETYATYLKENERACLFLKDGTLPEIPPKTPSLASLLKVRTAPAITVTFVRSGVSTVITFTEPASP